MAEQFAKGVRAVAKSQSRTLTHQTTDIHEISFTNREEFESAWPHILGLKSKGAPITLLSSPDEALRKSIKAGVRVLCPLTGTLVTPEGTRYPPGSQSALAGGKFLRMGPPWPDDIKSASGVLPEYVVYKDGKWAPYTDGQPRARHLRRARTDIQLISDGDIIDWKRIPPPADTPIIDKRFKEGQSKADGGNGK